MQQEIVDEVKNASLETKKEVLREAIESASQYGNAGVLLSHVVKGASLDARQAAIREAVENDEDAARRILGTAVAAAPAEATKDAVVKAVRNADGDEAQELITEAINAASSRTAKSAIEEAGLSPETLDQIWLFIVKVFGYVLVGATAALVAIVFLDTFRHVEPDHIQIMLTVFTTVAGILAGFITGQAVGTAKERSRDRG